MTGFLARLALRAVGRPVGTRLVPRIDPRAAFVRAPDRADATGEALILEATAPLPNETDPRRPTGIREPAPGVERAAPRDETSRQWRGEGAPPAAERSMPAPSAREAAPVEMPADAPNSTDRIGPLPASRRESRNLSPPAARAVTRPLARLEMQADRGARSRPGAAEHVRPSATRASMQPERATQAHSEAVRPPATHEQRVVFDAPARRPSSTHSEARGEAGEAASRSAISVEIGRIEVRVAPPPPAPVPRSRAAPEGFDGYWRLRNYLERSG